MVQKSQGTRKLVDLEPVVAARARRVRDNLIEWYQDHGRRFPWRRPDEAFFRQIVTEILLKRTRAETVSRHYKRFFAEFQDWNDLASANISQLEESLRPLGLWRERAETINRLSTAIVELGGRLPKRREELESLPGFGQYVVNAAQLMRDVERAPLLDSNMERVLKRVFGPTRQVDIRYDPDLQSLAWYVCDCSQAKEVSWAILDLAASNCSTRRPLCVSCPLESRCRARMYTL